MKMIGMTFQFAAQQPYPSSPTHRLAKVYSFGTKQLDFLNQVALTKHEQQRLITQYQEFINEFIKQTQIISQHV